jgi:AraC-like DNA-binding protein
MKQQSEKMTCFFEEKLLTKRTGYEKIELLGREEERDVIHAWYESLRDAKDHIFFERITVEKRRASWTPYPHFHNCVEIAVGLRGSIPITINGESFCLSEGEICISNSLEPHKYFYSPGQACYVVLISSSFFNEVNKLGAVSFPNHVASAEGYALIKTYLDYALETWDADSLLCKRAFADTLAYLLLKYCEPMPKREMERQSAALLGAVQYICENYTDRLTVGAVAKRFGYSANYFSTAFNEFMGVSFPDYLNACRMIEFNRIRRENPSIPTCKAAKMCGFGSMNTFYRARIEFASADQLPKDPREEHA